jgi:hypothetical protein
MLDTEKVEGGGSSGGSVTPYSGRGNLTWSKTGGGSANSAGAACGGIGPRGSLGGSAGGDFGSSDRGLRGSFAPGQRNPLEIDMDALEDLARLLRQAGPHAPGTVDAGQDPRLGGTHHGTQGRQRRRRRSAPARAPGAALRVAPLPMASSPAATTA